MCHHAEYLVPSFYCGTEPLYAECYCAECPWALALSTIFVDVLYFYVKLDKKILPSITFNKHNTQHNSIQSCCYAVCHHAECLVPCFYCDTEPLYAKCYCAERPWPLVLSTIFIDEMYLYVKLDKNFFAQHNI
jgi:hypothetical protein